MFHELKVKEMMYYFAAAKKVSKEKREAEIERVLADVNLSEKAEEKGNSPKRIAKVGEKV